ncbi:MAG: metallophosphoesterase [Prosthecobacter sp.]|jgi:hypothetical protein|uniref:metallophosphoesterase n=1 Tax=Prosthecobacter sp. TaxID=1965333 RepID=UPI0019EE6B68|nr:metallophosphoesterase [Prosthecobacter sp.]MBE2282709.1 metallophosphoesterase [Prosthecobacter sp.]
MTDVISDVHGDYASLCLLLESLGYRREAGTWRARDRRAVFCGDLVDRGPESRRVVEVVRRMVDDGQALAVMGNHELNMVLFHAEADGRPLKAREGKAWFSHQSTVRGYAGDADRLLEDARWLASLPFWLELPELRVTHAAWVPSYMDRITRGLPDGHDHETLLRVFREGGHLAEDITHLLKGPKFRLPPPLCAQDWRGREVESVQLAWWRDFQDVRCVTEIAFPGHVSLPAMELPAQARAMLGAHAGYAPDAPLVVVGHYRVPLPDCRLCGNVLCINVWHTGRERVSAYTVQGGEAALSLVVGQQVLGERHTL